MVLVPGAAVRVHDKVRDLGLARNNIRTQARPYAPCTAVWARERVAKRVVVCCCRARVVHCSFIRTLFTIDTTCLMTRQVPCGLCCNTRYLVIVIYLFSTWYYFSFRIPERCISDQIDIDGTRYYESTVLAATWYGSVLLVPGTVQYGTVSGT